MSETPQEQLKLTDVLESMRQAGTEAAEGGADPSALFGPLQDRMRGMLQEIEDVQSATYEGFSGLLDEGDEAEIADDERERQRRVLAEISGRGKLLRIDIGPYAMRDMDAEELSRACVEALMAARQKMAATLTSRITEITGFEIPSGDQEVTATEPVAPKDIMRKAKEAAGWNG